MRWLIAALLAVAAFAERAAPAAALPVLRIDAAREIPNEPKVPARLRMPGYRIRWIDRNLGRL
jgi:hypothetical protein